MMSSTCFEPEGSSSVRQLYIQLWCNMFYVHQYKQLLILGHAKHILPYLYIQQSSC